ncbi:type I DNA topoisomerase [Candidatus Nanosynsacchari sp. TM7_ANC_38.39_G1_1]|uniref:type I DNA topoisomerase n=1 Tax=Candidatus Nanosynsacchari sp. TM7_ANC_38.39_G1_1 TaxID=1986206 RepID=UPI00101CF9E6|nr:type I DNA topoisomerase [Candidatus Nanosynsacchari sp. TM7_ANC_38.39_G1_1]RYC72297.1 DNA topoisomerase 1 [Candidatus Nanosynsacchari sp. TM7_ANC_38.39_G1_1]
MKNLVIVESPAKAKTIEKYLGNDFHVLSSVGHIRAIAKKTKDGTPPIDIQHGFKTTYEIDPEKKKVIAELKKAVKSVGAANVWLATDEDREGEAIAWHLCEVLKLDPKSTKRITFHEITKSAIEEAIKHPRTVDMKLVEAQQARQILDRIVGFELSPVVWQKVPGGKSAGRVQSPAVRLLVEREHEIDAFAGSSQFKVTAIFAAGKQELKAELKQRFDSEEEARTFLESLAGATFTVANISTSPSSRNPAAPFTTSTLQQEANSKLGMGSRATMASAQKLYQEGRITYMRTDSVNLSSQAIAASADYIKRLYGIEYSHVRKFKTKSAGAQEAHEAIRPTDITRESVSGSDYDQRLYDLIRRRTLASQMAPAKLENTTITIGINDGEKQNNSSKTNDKLVFEAKGQVVLFDGFLRVYGGGKDDTILPTVKSGDQLQRHSVEARQVFARPPARYTEGTLVKKLEELGIGRPSTYATIMNTIQTRGYAEKGDSEGVPRDVILLQLIDNKVEREIVQEKTGSNKGKLVPTPAGELISGFLTDHFNRVVDYGFTADVEKDFDDIAGDRLARNTMLEKFYAPFHALIEQSGNIDRRTVGANREVGIDPKSGKPIIARFGRFGPMLQLGSSDDKADKPQFAPLPKGAKIETVTLEQALHAFELPRLVGQTEDGQDIKANVGRFGPYIQIGKLYVSLKDIDPREVTQEQARELYAAKLKAEAEKNIADFGDGIKVLNGRFGPYVTDGNKNAKIPKDTDPKTITRDQAVELLANAPQKRSARRQIRRKK